MFRFQINKCVDFETCTSIAGVSILRRLYMYCVNYSKIPSIAILSALFSFVLLLLLMFVHYMYKICWLSSNSFTFIFIKQPIYFAGTFLNPYAMFSRSNFIERYHTCTQSIFLTYCYTSLTIKFIGQNN